MCCGEGKSPVIVAAPPAAALPAVAPQVPTQVTLEAGGRRFAWWALLLAALAGYVVGDLLND